MKKRDSMRIIRRLYVSLAPIQAMAVGLPAINTLLSSILIGKFLGEDALAAVGFASPLLLCISAVTKVFAGGAQIIAGKAVGRGDRAALVRVFNTVLVMCAAFCLLTPVLCLPFSRQIAFLQGASGGSIYTSAKFVRGIGIGMGFSAMSACVFIFLQFERMDKVSGILSLVITVINIGGNALNIFCLKWGILGAGLFLSLSNIVAAGIGLAWLLVKGKIFHIEIRAFRWKEAWEVVRLGSPNAVISLTCMVRNRVMNHYVYMLGGTAAMAAVAVAANISTAVGNVIEAGYTGACEMVSGMLIGQRDVEKLRKLPKAMADSVGWIYAAAYALIFALAKPFALLMGAEAGNADALNMYAAVIRLFNLWYFTSIVLVPPRTIYKVMGKVGFVSLANIAFNAGLNSILMALFSRRAGLWLPVSAPWISELAEILLLVIYISIKMRCRPRPLFKQCYIPASLCAPREDRFERTILSAQDAARVSQEAIEFCRSKRLDEAAACRCGLYIEEIATDTVTRRFDGPSSAIDIHMVYDRGHIRLLLRDNCLRFDPERWLKLCAEKDSPRGISMRTVSQPADKMKYVNTLGLNVLTIEL